MERICHYCHESVPTNARFCKKCGKQMIDGAIVNCPNCNFVIPANKKPSFCPSCGKKLESTQVSQRISFFAPDIDPYVCSICKLKIVGDLFFCPACINGFHFMHLFKWVEENEQCPICRKKIIINKN
ncbi:MAG: zinc ribbon domain-containing protein [Candidatus Heimdallarchaeota archaeon]|nr:zinc ribbon domain-containing protein [Candidatus Heimdallarchaeota archaeon]